MRTPIAQRILDAVLALFCLTMLVLSSASAVSTPHTVACVAYVAVAAFFAVLGTRFYDYARGK